MENRFTLSKTVCNGNRGYAELSNSEGRGPPGRRIFVQGLFVPEPNLPIFIIISGPGTKSSWVQFYHFFIIISVANLSAHRSINT